MFLIKKSVLIKEKECICTGWPEKKTPLIKNLIGIVLKLQLKGVLFFQTP